MRELIPSNGLLSTLSYQTTIHDFDSRHGNDAGFRREAQLRSEGNSLSSSKERREGATPTPTVSAKTLSVQNPRIRKTPLEQVHLRSYKYLMPVCPESTIISLPHRKHL
jgi:hypothetical protein